MKRGVPMLAGLRNRIANNPFFKSVLILMGGSVLSQVIPFLASPALSRIYTPEHFATFTLFLSTVNILGVITSLKYDLAIVVAREEEAPSVFWLCLLLSGGLMALLFLLAPVFIALMPSLSEGHGVGWVYMVPLSVFLTGLFSALDFYNLRLNRYRTITQANIVRSVISAAVQIVLGLMGFGVYGLMVGQLLAYLAGDMVLMRKLAPHVAKPNFKQMAGMARMYKSFAKYTMPGTLATTLSYNSVSYFLTAFFKPAELGYYALINQVLSAPLTVISGAVGNVFLKKSSDEAAHSRMTAKTFSSVTRVLTLLSVPVFTILFVFATPIIRIFLGEQWLPAAAMVRALIPMFLARFIITPVSSSAIVAGRQGASMVWQFSLLAASVAPALVQLLTPLPILSYLTLLSVLVALCYVVFYLYCRRILKQLDTNY